MKLAILTHEPFYPPSGGGSAELLYLVKRLTKRNHEVHLFCPKFSNYKKTAKQFSIEIHPFKGWQMNRYTRFRSFKYLLFPMLLRRMVKKVASNVQFDIIFSQHAISSVAAGQLKTDLKVPVVMNFLDHLTGFMETWPHWRMPRFLLKRLMQFELNLPSRYNADIVLTVSKELSKRFIENGYDASRVFSINYGYDAQLFKPKKLRPQSPPTVVMHGSFDTHHLGEIATEAIYSITQERPDIHFLFIGKETIALKNLTKKINKLSPATNITCTGFVDYNLISEKLSEGHVGIIPYEQSAGTHCAFVAKMVEYAAVGLPVVSTPLAGTKKFFSNEATIIFSKFDGKIFAEDTLHTLNSTPQPEAAVNLTKRVANELDWKIICDNIVN
ncbi:MAG: glycosyltransferase family 4 protein, partial [Verrucomicrobiota bacterium]|nr:glycosyltransferase family 4 protein [Verrucomicrobiota bacterium]